LLAFDDLDLSLGTVRIRPAGGAGGHNGVADVLAALGTDGVPRVRLGIGRPPPGWDAADYVLSRFSAEEAAVADQAAELGSRAIEAVLRDGLHSAMNRYN
jgi:PTH1 family peptidyl-tRNA hydrolase